MGILEIICGVLLILSSLVIVALVLFQDSTGNGLSGVIGGGEMLTNDSRSRMPSSMMAKYTKYAAIAFFILTILVGVVSIATE
jgi:preprotein translocase subunit SecG